MLLQQQMSFLITFLQSLVLSFQAFCGAALAGCVYYNV